MYVRECRIQNVGPIDIVDLSMPFNPNGNPKPLVLVGRNGAGKSILLAHIVDGLIEFAKSAYRDVVPGQNGIRSPYYKILGATNQRSNTAFGLSLVRFEDRDETFCYIDKTGSLNDDLLLEQLSLRFLGVAVTAGNLNQKVASMGEETAKRVFGENAICYFPSYRHEAPHWSNDELTATTLQFRVSQRYNDILNKPIVVETAAEANLPWLLDVYLDSFVDVEPRIDPETLELSWTVSRDPQSIMLLRQSRLNVETLVQRIIEDQSARLSLSYRNQGFSRLSIETEGGAIPSLRHLSSGQASLFNLFATVIRYADQSNINMSHRLTEIEGIVIIDEIEA